MNLIGVNSPVRLLREKWASPVELAQELYAMFTAKGPTELHDTLTIRVPKGQTALRIEQVEGDASTTSITHGGIAKNSISTAPSVPGRRHPPPPAPSPSRPAGGRAAADAAFQPVPASVVRSPAQDRQRAQPEAGGVEIAAPVRFSARAPVAFSMPPVVFNPRTGRQEEVMTRGQAAQQEQAAYAPIFGIVQEGSGDTYQVQFFPSGYDRPGTPTNYTVKVPHISPDEVIPQGTKLFPIWKIQGVYYHQPAVWSE